MIIPKMRFENCTFSEALDQLASWSQKFDPYDEHTGINVVGIDEDRAQRVTLTVPPNSRFIDAAHLVAKACNYEVQDTPWGVVFRPKRPKANWTIREKGSEALDRLEPVVIKSDMTRGIL